MSTLYNLTHHYQVIYEMEELDSELWMDTLESIDEAIEDKADGYAKVINQLKADEVALSNEIKRLQDKKIVVKNKQERLRRNLEQAMLALEKQKFKTELFSFNIQKNPKSVRIEDEDNFIKNEKMEDYLIYQTPRIDRKLLLKDLENGVEIEGVEVIQSESLRIR